MSKQAQQVEHWLREGIRVAESTGHPTLGEHVVKGDVRYMQEALKAVRHGARLNAPSVRDALHIANEYVAQEVPA